MTDARDQRPVVEWRSSLPVKSRPKLTTGLRCADAMAEMATPRAEGRWALASLWTVRGVATLNVIAAAYLVMSGWIGWRTWV
jgi:hypothetical protein